MEFESELRSGFRSRNGELKCSGVSGSESDNSPFRCARPKLTLYSDFPYPKAHSTHLLVPTGTFGWIYQAEQYFGPGRGCCSGRKPVRRIRPKIPVGTKKCVEWGFGYGESEYKVSFGLAPRNGELSPSEPKNNPERSSDSNSLQSLGSVGQNSGSRCIYT